MTLNSLDCLIYSSERSCSSPPENLAVVSLYEYNGCDVGLSSSGMWGGGVWYPRSGTIDWKVREVYPEDGAEIPFQILIPAHYMTHVTHPRTVLFKR